MAWTLKKALQKSLAGSLRTTLAFDFPSINLLTQIFLTELFPQQTRRRRIAAPPFDHDEALDELPTRN